MGLEESKGFVPAALTQVYLRLALKVQEVLSRPPSVLSNDPDDRSGRSRSLTLEVLFKWHNLILLYAFPISRDE